MRIAAPNHVRRTYTQKLVAEPARVFPLYCPVRETDWLEGWDPVVVMSRSGFAEPDAVFVTDEEVGAAVWYITQHDPDAGFVEMIKIVPHVVATRLTIQLRAAEGGSEATISYAHTSLGPAGDDVVASFTEERYRAFMEDWQARMNHYLEHGTRLPGAHG